MTTYYTPTPSPRRTGSSPWNGAVVTFLLIEFFISGWLGMKYLIAVDQWTRCGADQHTAATAPLYYGSPDALQCLALLLTKK